MLEPRSPAARKALVLVEGQHRLLAALREEAVELLRRESREGCAPLRGLVARLARLLRRHFEEEERELWPSFNVLATRTALGRLERLARVQLRAMTQELNRYEAEVADYLGSGR
jgi:hypothetical protein